MAQEPSLWDRFTQAVSAGWQTLWRRAGLDNVQAVMVDLSKEEMARIGPDTKDVKGVYFSDFVEGDNPNQIRPAREFRKTADTLVTDKHIPLSRISRFYGIEDGKIKVGGIGNFNDSTVVVPVRNKNYGSISHVDINVKSFWDRFHMYSPRQYYDLLRANIDYRRKIQSDRKMQVQVGVDALNELQVKYGYDKNEDLNHFVNERITSLQDKLDSLSDKRWYIIRNWYADAKEELNLIENEEDGLIKEKFILKELLHKVELADRIKDYRLPGILESLFTLEPRKAELSFKDADGNSVHDETMARNADCKIVLADSTGVGYFINDIKSISRTQIDELNQRLKEHPLYPILVDNGRYSHYQLEAGSYRNYIRQDLYRPDKNLFVIGSITDKRSRSESMGKNENAEEKAERRQRSSRMYNALNQGFSNALENVKGRKMN